MPAFLFRMDMGRNHPGVAHGMIVAFITWGRFYGGKVFHH